MTAPEHDPAVETWGRACPSLSAAERKRIANAKPTAVYVARGLIMPDRWEGDDS